MSLYAARRRPYPFHVIINGTGLLLGAPRPTQGNPSPAMLVSSKIQDISQVSPPDYSYAGSSPISDRDQPYESLVLGYGWRVQEKWQDMRYASAQAVDLSVWPWCKGPEITTFTPPVRDSVRTFFELGTTLYAAAGRYILRRDSDFVWTMVKDYGAGVSILNVTVFTSNFDGVQLAWIALSTGPAHYFDGTTSTAMATFTALAFASVGREFWWATDTNHLRKCDSNANPRLEANYTATQFRVGDKSSPVTALMISAAGTLLIAKTDGVYTLTQTGEDRQLFPFLEFAPVATNGKAWGQFENSLYTSYGRNLVKIDTDLSGTDVGPERLVNNDSPVRGRITSFTAIGGMFALAGLFNPDTNTGYLMKFGAYASQGVEASDVRHIDVWHGSISVPFASGQAIQALFPSTIGAPSAHTRTYLGFPDGTVGWLVNPCVANPAACAQYRFHVGDGFVDLPTWHGGYHASVKSLRHFSVTGEHLDANNYVTLQYKLDPAAAGFTELGPKFDTATYETAQFPTSASAVLAEFRVHLQNTAATASPLVSAVSIGHALRPKRYMQVELQILCADGLVRRDGVPMRLGRKAIQCAVEAAVDTPGAVRCILPDESEQDLSFTDFAISQSFDEIGRQWRGSLTVKAVQWDTVRTEL